MTKRKRKIKLLFREKLLYSFVMGMLIVTPIYMVFAKAKINTLNIGIQDLESQVSIQEKTNESLVMKINELSSFENVQIVVQNLGLTYNNKNVKSINR